MRCPKRARDHHHLVKPRASNHVPWLVVAMCRDHHDRCDWPYQRGRLCFRYYASRFATLAAAAGETFLFEIVYVSEKRRAP